MAAPNVSYSVSIRVELENHPGKLGRLTTAIGEAGGNILGLDIVDSYDHLIVRDITVLAADEEHVSRIRKSIETLDRVRVLSLYDRTFRMHLAGKIEIASKAPLSTRDDLSMAYTPGVARVSMAIAEEPTEVHNYTIKANSVAVVTDGTAVLGLGDIGPYAAMPVMEGKAMLFKEFAGIDAFPICLNVSSSDQLVDATACLEPAFGGINLEDVAAPRCFEVEERLKESLDIPVFHDDQHGTAVVVLAALRNALKVAGKKISGVTVVIVGAGAAGVAVARILSEAGVSNIVAVDRRGAIYAGRQDVDASKIWMGEHTNPERRQGKVSEVLAGSDVLIGVSGPGLITRDDLKAMAPDPVVFALANPTPEVDPEEAADIASVVATGRSDYPNQINNVLCFPGIFRGALDAGATAITESMKLAAAEAISSTVTDDELSPSYIVPSVFNRSIVPSVAAAVVQAARNEGVIRDRERVQH